MGGVQMRKVYFYHPYDIPRLTNWLNEWSAHGWEMEVWGVFFVKFRKLTDGEHYNYQVDMDDTSGDPGVFRREELAKLGWEYVGTIGVSREHVYRHKDKYARLPRNEAYVSFNQKKLNSELFWSGILGFLVLALLLYFFILRNEFFLLTFMQQKIETLIFYTVWFSLMLYQVLADTFQNVKLYRYLEDYGKQGWIQAEQMNKGRDFCFPAKLMSWIIVLFYTFTIFGVHNRQNVENLGSADPSLKYVDLAEIEGVDFSITDISWDDYPDVNFGNRIVYRNVPLAHTYYEINQYGENEKTGEYIQMEGLYWDIKREKTAEKMFGELVECYIKYPYGYNMGLRNYKYHEANKWTKREILDERFTELIVATGSGYAFEGEQRIFARIGNEVVYLRHNGEADTETMIEAIAEKFT